MSVTYPISARKLRQPLLAGATVVFACLTLVPWAVTFGPVTGGSAGILAAVVVTAAMASVYLLASRNPGTPWRLSQARRRGAKLPFRHGKAFPQFNGRGAMADSEAENLHGSEAGPAR